MPDKALICKFQSTPSQRGRRYFDLPPKECKNFNPRPRKEGDMNTLQNAQPIILFQSTPSQRGRLEKIVTSMFTAMISIHALAKRATPQTLLFVSQDRHFNPRPRKEGDFTDFNNRYWVDTFQSTPSQRGRLSKRMEK